MAYVQVNRLASIHIDIVFCRMPFMQAAFVYTVQLAIGCVHAPLNFFLMMPHINVSMFLMCVYISSRFCPTIKNFLATPLFAQKIATS